MPSISWGRALLIWGHALAWFLVNDLIKLAIKLAACRVFDPQEGSLLGRISWLAKLQATAVS